jgi:hypothetical protein
MGDSILIVKVSSETTAGRFTVIDNYAHEGNAAPLHVHHMTLPGLISRCTLPARYELSQFWNFVSVSVAFVRVRQSCVRDQRRPIPA